MAVVTNIAYTNMSGDPEMASGLPVRIIRQAVFVNIEDSGITGQVRFSPSSSPTNAAQTVAVRLTMTSTNVITQLPQTASIYLVDTLASETNRGLNVSTESINPYYLCSGSVHRPANYIVSRLDSGNFFANGFPGSGLPPPNFFNDSSFSNNVVLVDYYTDYAVYIDNLTSDQQLIGAVTNLGGGIIINANNLDLTKADLVAGGYINIQANNLVSSTNAVVSCQNLSFNLGSTNGHLNITNLADQSVSQLQGNIVAWTGAWTNTTSEIIPNYAYDVATSNYDIPAFFTNSTEIDFYVLVVDASSLSSQVSVTVQNLSLHSTNIVVSDFMTVANSFLLDGQTFTLLGELTLSGAAQNWTAASAPTLRYFTNEDFLVIGNNADFGNDTAAPYTEFVNYGWIDSGDQTIDSLDLQIINGINETSVGNFSATAGSIEITGPTFFSFSIYSNSIYSANDIQLSANTVLIDPADLYANGALDFTVTNSLSDNGAANFFTCYNGFNLWIKPQTGDLLGSTITSIASLDNEEIDHAWAGQDRGTNGAGFLNNVAIGTLVLSAQNPDSQLEPLFHFYGTGVSSNAMYVATLDLSQLTTSSANLASMIQIDPGMKIYFSRVILGFTLPGSQTPAQFMTNQFPNQFIYLPNPVVTQSGTVDWNTVYQRIDGFGASSAFSGRTWSAATADAFFSTNTGIGLSLLRNSITTNVTASASELGLMQLAQARGARVWSTPWSPPPPYTTNNSTVGSGFVPSPANYQAYANQLANYVVTMQNNGVTIYALSIQNEPDAVVDYTSCYWSPQEYHDFVPFLRSALTASNAASTKIMLPEDEFWETTYYSTAMSDLSVATNVDIIGNHNYDNTDRPAAPLSLYSNPNAALWETEVSTFDAPDGSIANGMMWAARIHAFLTVAQVNAWHYWWLITGNADNEGLELQGDIPTKRMYVVGQYSRFVRPGYHRVGVNTSSGALLVTAFKDSASPAFAIVAVNTSGFIGVNQTFNLTNFPAAGYVTPWITSSNLSLANLPPVTVNNSSFTYTIPAQSVVTFVGQATTNAPLVVLQLTPVADPTINAGVTLMITNAASDPNVPPALTFSLLSGPTNAALTALNATNILFKWRPLVSQANTTNLTTVKVADSVGQSATNSFKVIVNPLAQPRFSSINVSGGQINLALTGTTGPDYTLWTSTNLVTWQTLSTTNSPPLPITLVVTNTRDRMRFYRIQAGP
jgi:glucuronoarabinoxylan endo-1,4-beta-xylanase